MNRSGAVNPSQARLDGNDENLNFVEKRRQLRAVLGDENFTLKSGEAANMGEETVHATKWETDFIMMARRKKTGKVKWVI